VGGVEMLQVKSILVALGRDGDPAAILARSVTLARRFSAGLEIFLCEAEGAYALQHQYDVASSDAARRSGLSRSNAWLQRLWNSLQVNDVPVTMEAVYESPLCEAVGRKVERNKPDLVVRGIGGQGGSTFSVSDFDLVRCCPGPLLLTRGRPWKASPSVAAAVDISGEESPQLIRTILRAAGYLAVHFDASLEVFYAGRFENAPPEVVQSHEKSLRGHAAVADVRPRRAHVVIGEPARVIPRFVAQQGYELLVLGALTHTTSTSAPVGTLTGRLLETVDCELLLVKPSLRTATS
jgi:universal stress protein E